MKATTGAKWACGRQSSCEEGNARCLPPVQLISPNVHVELKDAIAIVHLARPAKRNALNDETVFSLERWFSRPLGAQQIGRVRCARANLGLRSL
jgi:hypothetical protein